MSTFSKPVFMDGTKAVGLSIALGVVVAFLPVLSIAAVPLLPIPAAYITVRHGRAAAVGVGVITGALAMALTGVAPGLLVTALVVLTGLGAGIGLKRGLTEYRLFIAIAVLFCMTLFLWGAALLAIAGVGPVSAMEQLADSAVEPSRQVYSALGMSEQEVDDLVSQLRDFAVALPYMAPALLLALSVTFSGATVAVSRRVFERLKQPFPRDFSFRELRVHFAFAYMMIAGLLCELTSSYLPDSYSSAVDVVGTNLLIVSEVVFFIQGMAIASFFLLRFKISRVKSIAVYACLILLQLTLSLTSWMGLFDIWIDYRRRFAGRKTAGE